MQGVTYVKTPPSSGPATEAIPHIPPIKPKAAGLFLSGTVSVSLKFEGTMIH